MDDSNVRTYPSARNPSRIAPARGAAGAMIATSVALAALLAAGIGFPAVVIGPVGVGLCGVLGSVVGAIPRGPGSILARILGGGVGGVVAGWFAIAAAELLPPATMQWAYSGGALAAMCALPVAAVVGGLVGLLGAVPGAGGRPCDGHEHIHVGRGLHPRESTGGSRASIHAGDRQAAQEPADEEGTHRVELPPPGRGDRLMNEDRTGSEIQWHPRPSLAPHQSLPAEHPQPAGRILSEGRGP